MIVVQIVAEELRVRPINLPRGLRISRGINLKCALLVNMHVVSKFGPVFRTEPCWMFGDRCAVRDGLIAGENAAMQEAGTAAVDGKLEIAIEIAVTNALLKSVRNIFQVVSLNDPAHFHAAAEPQLHGRNQPEQPVATNSQTKKLRVGLPAAFAKFAVAAEQCERFHIGDDGLVLEY